MMNDKLVRVAVAAGIAVASLPFASGVAHADQGTMWWPARLATAVPARGRQPLRIAVVLD
jgi:hypothetical protein